MPVERNVISASEPYIYEAFGMTIKSEFPVPELVTDVDPESKPDVEYRLVPRARTMRDNSVEYVDGKLYIQILGAAQFCIEGGKVVTVSPTEGGSWDKIRLYLLGTCMGALLLQRGILPLHGSAVAIDGKAYIFVGNSGAGKSTLAASLLRHGASFLSDDIAAVYWDPDGTPHVSFAYPQQKLWRDSLDHFGMDAREYRMVMDGEDKYAVPLRQGKRTLHAPLAGIYELDYPTDTGHPLQLTDSTRLEGIHLLLVHTYRNTLIRLMGLEKWHFEHVVSLLENVLMRRLIRPAGQGTVQQAASTILNDIRREKDHVATIHFSRAAVQKK